MPAAPEAAILVEGLSDCLAVEAAARRSGRDLEHERIVVVPMGGATNLGRYLAHFGPAGLDVRVAGLCDLGEAPFFRRALHRAAISPDGFFVCDRDLEDELIRALGPDRVESVIEQQGELASLRTLQQMPFHRGRPIEDQLHRFMGVRSGRKHRYAPLLVDALDGAGVPRPLQELLAHL